MAQHHQHESADSDGDRKEEGLFTMEAEPAGAMEPYKLPRRLFQMLYRHQQEGLRWLWALHCKATGGILADEMGLGKTMLVSGFLAGLFHSGLIKRSLIVAPKSVLTHWVKELSAVGLEDKIRDYTGTSINDRSHQLQCILKEGGILLTTYDIVRNNSSLIRGNYCGDANNGDEEMPWDYVILDEGHIMRNLKTQRAQSLFQIRSAHRIVITGTPYQNNLMEMWALFYFCCPDILGDKDEFKVRYEKPLLCGNDKNATDQEKHMSLKAANEFKERIKPYFLRRLESELFGNSFEEKDKILPQKNELTIWLKLTSCQRQLYEAFLKLVHSQTEALKLSSLEAITILKTICDHPLLLTQRAAEDIREGMGTIWNNQAMCLVERILEDGLHVDNVLQVVRDVSCKIGFILPLLKNLVEEGHNVLIFSQSRKMLNAIQQFKKQESIVSEGHKLLRIDGNTKVSERAKIVKDFQDGSGAPILLLSSQVGGLGNTLTKANRVIIVDPSWNPSTDNQSVSRAYRIGQRKDVIVYRLVTCGTIEEKIYKLQVFKGGLFKTAVEHTEQAQYFNQEDMREYLSSPTEGFDVSPTQHQLQEEHSQQLVMDESLRKHIQFLEQQGIAGVSHHSLLFQRPVIIPTLDDSVVLDRKPKDILVRRCFAKRGRALAPEQTIDDDMLKNMKTGRANEIYEIRKEMASLEETRRHIRGLEHEYVRELVEMPDSASWDKRHLEKTREQIDGLHREYAARFDEMMERIKQRTTCDMVEKMAREMMELDQELIADFDEMVETMMQTSKLDGEVVRSLAFLCE